MFKNLRAAWRQVERAPLRVRIILLLAVAYLLSPIDVIPDFIPGVGQLDDVLLVVLVTRYVRKHVPGFELGFLPKKKSKKVSKTMYF